MIIIIIVSIVGEESMHVLDKITTLEQQRLNLLTELQKMKEKNNTFWETLQDLVSHMTFAVGHMTIILCLTREKKLTRKTCI